MSRRATVWARVGRVALLCGLWCGLSASSAVAAGRPDGVVPEAVPPPRPALRASFAAPDAASPRRCCASVRFDAGRPPQDPAPPAAPRPRAFVYSDGYHTRAKIHRLASFAMLPLFAAEAVIGQKMFNNPASATGSMRTAHRTIAYAIGGLFGVNTVTGVWNLMEGRKDPSAGMRRVIHGVLMLVADGGFLATALTRPKSNTASQVAIYDAKKNQHLALAYASVSVATVGYLIMLFK